LAVFHNDTPPIRLAKASMAARGPTATFVTGPWVRANSLAIRPRRVSTSTPLPSAVPRPRIACSGEAQPKYSEFRLSEINWEVGASGNVTRFFLEVLRVQSHNFTV